MLIRQTLKGKLFGTRSKRHLQTEIGYGILYRERLAELEFTLGTAVLEAHALSPALQYNVLCALFAI